MNIVFNEETGLLVPGEHKLTIEEFEKIFVYNDKRQQIYNGFRKLMTVFREIGCSHLYADGSFVTKKPYPGDIDVCWHMHDDIGPKIAQLTKLKAICSPIFELDRKFIKDEFCADVFPANQMEGGSGIMFKDFFQKDKHTNESKGIVIIELL
ncbi:DUF6932 family protein [Sphingobacterium ginsenosidimutans]|uniref:Nucleotidyltransferase n=1 Tax=Sphingobacterium ginsenosidimutans TaxID=687845 RepID=A0ABP7ZW64_9SPHI